MNQIELVTQAMRFINKGVSKERRSDVQIALERSLETGYEAIIDEVDKAVNVNGKHLLEVGCGACWHAPFFLARGARSYTGIDLFTPGETNEIFDRHFSHDLRTPDTLKSMPLSFAEFIESFVNVKAIQADFIDMDLERSSFDAAFMLTVSEHLTDTKAALQKVFDALKPGGKLYLSHGNYYCWNGHHLAPRNVRDYDLSDSSMQAVADWGHVRRLVKNDLTGPHVNYLRLHELTEMLEDMFRIDSWEFHDSSEERGGSRLTEEIRRYLPGYYREELLTEMAYFTCTKMTTSGNSTRIRDRDAYHHRFAIEIRWCNHENGFCYISRLPSLGKMSNFILLENLKELGPSESIHEDIRKQGKGRFSVWGNHLYFSASDNSNPGTNERIYILIDPRILHAVSNRDGESLQQWKTLLDQWQLLKGQCKRSMTKITRTLLRYWRFQKQ